MHRWTSGLSFLALLLSAPATTSFAQLAAATSPRDPASLKNQHAMEILIGAVEKVVVSSADAMPADKFSFAPTEGEFGEVRTFGKQAKHLAATNYMLAAAALGQDPPSDAGDEA